MLLLAIAYRYISKRQDFDKDLKGILAFKKKGKKCLVLLPAVNYDSITALLF